MVLLRKLVLKWAKKREWPFFMPERWCKGEVVQQNIVKVRHQEISVFQIAFLYLIFGFAITRFSPSRVSLLGNDYSIFQIVSAGMCCKGSQGRCDWRQQ